MDKLTEFHKECIRNCINHKRATSYRSKYNKLSDEEVIRQCRSIAGYSDSQEFTLKELCEAQKLDINKVIEFISDVSNDINESDLEKFSLADWVIGYINTQRCNTIEGICDILNRQGYDVSIPRFKGIKRRNPDWTTEEIIGYCMLNASEKTNNIYYINIDNKEYTLRQLCEILKIDYTNTRRCVVRNNNIDTDRLLALTDKLYVNILGQLRFKGINEEHKIEKKKLALKEMAESAGIKYKTAKEFKDKHSHISNELVIKALAYPEKLTIKDKCDIAGVNNRKVYHYRDNHPDITVEEAIKIIKYKEESR